MSSIFMIWRRSGTSRAHPRSPGQTQQPGYFNLGNIHGGELVSEYQGGGLKEDRWRIPYGLAEDRRRKSRGCGRMGGGRLKDGWRIGEDRWRTGERQVETRRRTEEGRMEDGGEQKEEEWRRRKDGRTSGGD